MPGVARTMVLRRRAEPVHVFVQGDFTRLGEQVQPGVPVCCTKPICRRIRRGWIWRAGSWAGQSTDRA